MEASVVRVLIRAASAIVAAANGIENPLRPSRFPQYTPVAQAAATKKWKKPLPSGNTDC
jgi:hypothetical protein